MHRWLFLLLGSCAGSLLLGCVARVDNLKTNNPVVQKQIEQLFDSVAYNADVTENSPRVLHFLEQLRPLCMGSAELTYRYTQALLSVSWRAQDFEDVLTEACASLYGLSVKGEIRSGKDAHISLLAAHALRKSGDTNTAIKLYEFLSTSEFLAMRRGGQSNLLALYSKRGNHVRAIELANILQPIEAMSPTDISAQVNLQYFWGRSLFLSGQTKEGRAHLQMIIPYLNAPRSNLNTSELRVRISTARNILRDNFSQALPQAFRKELIGAAQRSIVLDSTTLTNSFHCTENPGKLQKVTIPEHLFIRTPEVAWFMKEPSLDEAVITTRASDSRGVRWVATLFGLYVRVGHELVRVDLPHHRGIPRPVKSLVICNDTISVTSYRDSVWRYPIARLIHNHTIQQSLKDLYTVRSASLSHTNDSWLVHMRLPDSSILAGTGNGLQYVTPGSSSATSILIPNRNALADTVLSIFTLGNSVVTNTRTFGYRVIDRRLLKQGSYDFIPFDAFKVFSRMGMSDYVSGIVYRQLIGEHPSSRIPIVDELHPATLQRTMFLSSERFVNIRTTSILAVCSKTSQMQLVEWPDSIASALRGGFFPSIVNDSIISIRTNDVDISLNIAALLRRPLPRPLIAMHSNGEQAPWIGWLDGSPAEVSCSNSISIVVGSSSIVSDYLTSTTLIPEWSADSLHTNHGGIVRLDVPNLRSCSVTVAAPGVFQAGTVYLTPKIHALLYQDILILIVISLSAIGGFGVVIYWHKEATRNRQNLERQHSVFARDLHDTLGADLARLSALLRANDSSQSRDIASAALAANRKFRSLLWIWSSDSILLRDFIGELREYISACLADLGIACSSLPVALDERRYIDATIAKNVLIVFNEVVTNVIRHSSARHVDFDVVVEDTSATVRFHDNGIGFDKSKLARQSGIDNIVVRAHEHGFHVEIVSAPDAGTTVLVTFGVYNL